MRTVGMLRTGSILVFFIVSYASTLPLQWLPAIPGFVPVYIRHGDEPLEDINLELAEAFAEDKSFAKNVKDAHEALPSGQPVYVKEIEAPPRVADSRDKLVSEKPDGVTDEKGQLVKEAEPDDRETNGSNVSKESSPVIHELSTVDEKEDPKTEKNDAENKHDVATGPKKALLKDDNFSLRDSEILESLEKLKAVIAKTSANDLHDIPVAIIGSELPNDLDDDSELLKT